MTGFVVGLCRLRGGMLSLGALFFALASLSGCSLLGEPESEVKVLENPRPATSGTSERLESSWGPGEGAALLTGTFSSKDRNLAFNVPTASWYVREKHRKGLGILGGALAYDMVTTRFENGAPVSRKLLSHGLLGIAGRLDERRLDGTGYRKSHWLFPLYRYHNVNGQRAIYPLFIFPVPLRDDEQGAYDPAPWDTAWDQNIDPEEVKASTPVPTTTREAPEETSLSSRRDYQRPDWTQRSGRPIVNLPDLPESSSDQKTTTPASNQNIARGGWKSESAAASRSYQVKKGDTLYAIARREYGDVKRWRTIHEANRGAIPNPHELTVGAKLVLPR